LYTAQNNQITANYNANIEGVLTNEPPN